MHRGFLFLGCTYIETGMRRVLGIREGCGDGRWQSWWLASSGFPPEEGTLEPTHRPRTPSDSRVGTPMCMCMPDHVTSRKKTAMARSTEGMERMTRSERYGANGTVFRCCASFINFAASESLLFSLLLLLLLSTTSFAFPPDRQTDRRKTPQGGDARSVS